MNEIRITKGTIVEGEITVIIRSDASNLGDGEFETLCKIEGKRLFKVFYQWLPGSTFDELKRLFGSDDCTLIRRRT